MLVLNKRNVIVITILCLLTLELECNKSTGGNLRYSSYICAKSHILTGIAHNVGSHNTKFCIAFVKCYAAEIAHTECYAYDEYELYMK